MTPRGTHGSEPPALSWSRPGTRRSGIARATRSLASGWPCGRLNSGPPDVFRVRRTHFCVRRTRKSSEVVRLQVFEVGVAVADQRAVGGVVGEVDELMGVFGLVVELVVLVVERGVDAVELLG